jgi:ADP-heptose:LPS heptosyltransferase
MVILRALGLGDLLTGVPALRALAAAFPGHRRLLAAPPSLAPLAVLSGAVHDIVPAAPLRRLDPRLAGCDVAVNLHGRGPQSHRLLAGLGPGRLVAFRHDDVPESSEGPAWRPDEHEVDRWCRMLEEQGIPADRTRLDLPAPPPALLSRGATIIHPGAASGSRRWPPERFAAVALRERLEGRPVLITGSRNEAALAAGVAEIAGLPPSSVLAGRTGLLELVRLVGGARRLVAGDTGIAHLATALGTPSVILFGPTDPARWGPPPERADRHRALWAGRTGDPHAARTDPGLLTITVQQVLDELDRLPDPVSGRPPARRARAAGRGAQA